MAKTLLPGIPEKYRGIIYVIATIVIVVVIGFIIKWLVQWYNRSKEQKDPKVVVNDVDKEYNQAIQSGQTLSKPSSAYSSAANAIAQLLDGCETSGSEINAIENVITVVKKPVDWFYLVKQFGVKEISDCGSFGYANTSYDLITLLKDQLDSSVVWYSIDVDGYKDSGATFETITILRKYLSGIGVTI